jgi:ERI1 exoribonuclease 2
MSGYVVIDLEFCKVPSSKRKAFNVKQEIIQIGAVLLNSEYEIVDQFSSYVKPAYGQIDPFIQKLTGISNDDVKDAADISTVLGRFFSWLPSDTVPVSWSFSDRKQLLNETLEKNLIFPGLEDSREGWTDCQEEFGEKLDSRRRYSLEEALIATDIITEGQAHDGLVDAYNTALLFSKMRTEKEFKLNPYYETAHNDSEAESLTFSMGDLFSGLNLAVG